MNRSKKNHLKIFFSLILLLNSCVIRPNYEPQYVDIPDEWRFEADEGSTLCNFHWWEQFEDPILNEFILIALNNNQDIKAAIARVKEFYDRYRVVYASLFPAISGNASYTRTKSSLAIAPAEDTIPTAGINRITNLYQLFFSFIWQIDVWGQLWSASEAAYADFLSQIENRRAIIISIVTSVANTYLILLQLDAQLNVSLKTLESRRESLKLATYRFELGETSELEVKQAESEVEIAAIVSIEFERSIAQQEDLLSILMGENPRSIERGISIDQLLYPIQIPAGLPSDLLKRRPDIAAAEDRLIASNARVTEAITLFFPQIELTGLYGNQSNKLSHLLTSPAVMWQYGISAVQPIFNAGQTYYQVQEAKAIRDENLANYRQTILNAFREVNDALISYQKNIELVTEHQKQVKVLTDYLHLAQLRYEEGEIDYLNILDAERSLFNAQLQLVQAQSDSLIAIVQLYGALGGGWVTEADEIAMQKCPINQ
jgi:multidrug efflux system outer membrane protein